MSEDPVAVQPEDVHVALCFTLFCCSVACMCDETVAGHNNSKGLHLHRRSQRQGRHGHTGDATNSYFHLPLSLAA